MDGRSVDASRLGHVWHAELPGVHPYERRFDPFYDGHVFAQDPTPVEDTALDGGRYRALRAWLDRRQQPGRGRHPDAPDYDAFARTVDVLSGAHALTRQLYRGLTGDRGRTLDTLRGFGVVRAWRLQPVDGVVGSTPFVFTLGPRRHVKRFLTGCDGSFASTVFARLPDGRVSMRRALMGVELRARLLEGGLGERAHGGGRVVPWCGQGSAWMAGRSDLRFGYDALLVAGDVPRMVWVVTNRQRLDGVVRRALAVALQRDVVPLVLICTPDASELAQHYPLLRRVELVDRVARHLRVWPGDDDQERWLAGAASRLTRAVEVPRWVAESLELVDWREWFPARGAFAYLDVLADGSLTRPCPLTGRWYRQPLEPWEYGPWVAL